MKTYLIVTITCPDRPGIVERITDIVVRYSANWEDSRMARLGGDFAGIVKLSVAPDDAAALSDALMGLADNETTIAVKAMREDSSTALSAVTLLHVRLSGADHEGIVHAVAACLAGEGVNVESMDTTVSQAPMSGSPLFEMSAVIKVPQGVSLLQLEERLQRIGDDLGVDIELTPASN